MPPDVTSLSLVKHAEGAQVGLKCRTPSGERFMGFWNGETGFINMVRAAGQRHICFYRGFSHLAHIASPSG